MNRLLTALLAVTASVAMVGGFVSEANADRGGRGGGGQSGFSSGARMGGMGMRSQRFSSPRMSGQRFSGQRFSSQRFSGQRGNFSKFRGGQRYGNWSGNRDRKWRGHNRRHFGRNFYRPYYWGGPVVASAYYYGDECSWLRRKALNTGSHYWWRRYEQCTDYGAY